MRPIRALAAFLLVAFALSSCNAPVREATASSDGALMAKHINNGEVPVAAEQEETTGVSETREAEEIVTHPAVTESPVTTKAPFKIPEPQGTTAHYITDAPPLEPEVPVKPEEPEEPEVKYPVILMYHCVSEEPTTKNTSLFVRPSDFESQARAIVENGINTLFADEFGEVEETSVILTFDDGYEDNYTEMFPILKKYGLKATVYMIAYKIGMPGYLTAEQIREMSDSGLVQFGSHTLDHPELSRLSEDDIRAQLEGSKWIISNVTGKPVTTLAYPSGKYNAAVMRIAEEMYEFAYTTDDDPYCGQDNMMLPRYAILRGETGKSFLRFIL